MTVAVMGWKDEGEDRSAFWEDMKTQIISIAAEDQHLFAPLQRSLNSGYMPTMLLGYQERVLYWYQEEIDRRIGVDRIPPPLRIQPVLGDHVTD